MLESSALQIIRMFPRGVTEGQLLFRLSVGGMRKDPSALLEALIALADRGEIVRQGDRWVVPPQSRDEARADGVPGTGARASAETLLRAMSGAVEPLQRSDDTLGTVDGALGNGDWSALVGYYASTQRLDPRGSVERFVDRHGADWQTVTLRGRWWDNARLWFSSEAIPATFREALAGQGHRGAAALGWPVTVMRQDDVVSCLPALLVPVSWELDPAGLTVLVDAVSPVLNPAWLRAVQRRRRGGQEALLDAIQGGEIDEPLDAIASRLAHALAAMGGASLRPADLAGEMATVGEGMRNVAALVLPDDSLFTRRVALDLGAIGGWSEDMRRGTALAALIEGGGLADSAPPSLVLPLPLSDLQTSAAEEGLRGPLTAIQGPPGTGKSQTIVAMIVTAVLAGRSVLFVARNHRALDEVERRVFEFLPELPAIVRARDAEGERDVSFVDALREIANGPFGRPGDGAAAAIQAQAEAAARARKVVAERDALNLVLSGLAERASAIREATPSDRIPRRPGLWVRLRMLLQRIRGTTGATLHDGASLAEIEAQMARLRRQLDDMPHMSDPGPVADPTALRAAARDRIMPDEATVRHLRQRLAELEFAPGGANVRTLTAEDARMVLRHRPVWAVSNLSVPGRVPLVPGLFDLAIVDEASQADIASSLPVLARARQAVVVGDPMQLSFIPALGRAQEHALMDAAKMPRTGRAGWAQSVNSLFDLTARRVRDGAVMLLADQFRSAPDIVAYTSGAFYGRRLVARKDDDDFRAPRGYRPGLHWEDVAGRSEREDGGHINRAEAEHIVARLRALAEDSEFDGSVGVISPFNAQVGLIRRLADEALPETVRQRIGLVIGTVDRWQGGEADVVYFSLVAGPDAAQGAATFLSRERRRVNVAISRAKAVAVVVGHLSWARTSRIAHIADLADRATRPPVAALPEFDSQWERRVDGALRRRGLDPKPQYPVGRRRLDFALFRGGVKLDLEVDGVRFHSGPDGGRKTADRLRDRELKARGWKVRRFWVWELQQDMEKCIDLVERDLAGG